ncbi:cation-translocating P-type ATPase [Candidatus Micrarchaeota archaeon]|nr:cation-translocating P-type ATPase [Candidatus Micrarchaeota archaeon]
MTLFHAKKVAEAFSDLESGPEGLSEKEAEKRLRRFGPNEIASKKKATAPRIFLAQFTNPLIVLLVFAGLLSLALGEEVEASAIFGIIILNVALGFHQEFRAEKALEALEKISAPEANVVRDGKPMRIAASQIVSGDVLVLEAGDIVAADARVLEAQFLQVDQAALTGESMPSAKTSNVLASKRPLADQKNMVFRGTTVTYGKGRALAVATGSNTEFGKIASSLSETKDEPTPLERKFSQLTKQIGVMAGGLVAAVFILGSLQGSLSVEQMLLFSLALTVSTIPSSLPIIVTVSLSLGAHHLAQKNMLVKKLTAAESLGSVTVICSDKTGTLTKNEMTVTKLYANGTTYDVSGSGYAPHGSISAEGRAANAKSLEPLFLAAYLCNNADLQQSGSTYKIAGDPTEGALVVLARKAGLHATELKTRLERLEELPFDSDRKRMTVIYENRRSKRKEAFVKGAPDLLLRHCTHVLENGRPRKLTPKDRKEILAQNHVFGQNALRVLALAWRDVSNIRKPTVQDVEKDLVFLGLAGMMDPPREEVPYAVKRCNSAGISVLVITGDHPTTAKAVARDIGVFRDGDGMLTGEQLDEMTDAKLDECISTVRIIARALPIQKLRVVEALQRKGHVVAMTGDGVNDAPALKKADIGVAMGKTGTDVAKEAAKTQLVDDNFASIVNAVAEGRNIYDKIIKSAKYLLSCNTGEIVSVFTAILLRFPLPLLPLQLLLMNLLTDELPALGLGTEGAEKDVMERKPRDPKATPLGTTAFASILLFGAVMAVGTLFMFQQFLGESLAKAQTAAFTTLVLFQLFAVLSSRSSQVLHKLNPLTNKNLLAGILASLTIQVTVVHYGPLQAIFGTVDLEIGEWLFIAGVASLGFLAMEVSKALTQYLENPQRIKALSP